MIIKTENDIKRLVESDEWMMDVLRAAEELNLPDWWIGAGFLRNKVWNGLEGVDSHSSSDVDLVYYDLDDTNPETDWAYDEKMNLKYPDDEWQVRNQARMHYVNNFPPFTSTEDAISNWIETATCIAVKLENGKLKFMFCHGIDDLVNLTVRPIPRFQAPELMGIYKKRMEKKNWQDIWPNLKIELK